jgi:hypothetical protein
MTDPRRQRPSSVIWKTDKCADLLIDGQLWSEVEWSEKRQAWCIQDAEGQCLRHVASIRATVPDKAAAVALAQAMIRDGRMPTPEQAKQDHAERQQRERERREKRPSEIARREAREKEDRLSAEHYRLEYVEEKRATPYWELLADVFDLADPDLWKRNSFAPLRDRLILSLKTEIAGSEYKRLAALRRRGKKRFARLSETPRHKQAAARLARAKELLALLQPEDEPPVERDGGAE